MLSIFDSEFMHNRFDYYDKKNTKSPQECLSLAVQKENVVHLLGIKFYARHARLNHSEYNQPSFASKFYKDFEKGQLKLNYCWIEDIKQVETKFEGLTHLREIKTENVRIGSHGNIRSIEITGTLSTSRTFLGLGLHHDNPQYSIPKTCLNLKLDRDAKKMLRLEM